MSNYDIGISGLSAAQKALDIIGNNIANAATDGYHRQRVDFTPLYSVQEGELLLGGGVDIAGITRMVDVLLEEEILRQQSSLGQVSQELGTLRTVESTFGEFTSGSGLNAAIDEFFNALSDLSADPTGAIWQNQVLSAAEALAGQFRTLGEFLLTLDTQLRLEAEKSVEKINSMATQIAELNDSIARIEIGGAQANNLRDQRDKLINELSGLIGIQTQSREYGVVDVTVGGIPLVTGATATALEAGLDESGKLGIGIAGSHIFHTDMQGGKIGGLLLLKNEVLSEIRGSLDDLAQAIIQEVNNYHVQGVGSDGSFTSLTGWVMPSENLSDFDPPVTNGKIYIRVTNTDTGEITRHEIDIDASTGTLSSIAADITDIDGLTASVDSSNRLLIQADTNYTFDFLPAVLPQPSSSGLTGSAPDISVSGVYTGTINQTFTFTVVGTGSVGNGTLQLRVEDGSGELITTVNVGAGYAAGDRIDIGSGIRISLGTGDLNNGETFQVAVFADTDTSGVLAAAGLNTFFSGTGASNMAVCSDIADSPGRIATALGADTTDNANALRLANLRQQAVSDLDGLTVGEFYRRLVADVGQQVSIKQARQDNIEVITQNLTTQQQQISGVDINEEATQLLVFEQMFKAMARYLNAVESSMASILELV
jgi:flagellar hook-associated protein 1 FlgK